MGEMMQDLATQPSDNVDCDGFLVAPPMPGLLPEPDSLSVAAQIRSIRLAKKRKLREIASATGTTPQTIQRLESGSMTLSVDWLLRICKALGIDPACLFTAHDETLTSVVATVDAAGQLQRLPESRHETVTLTGSVKGVFGVRVVRAVGDFEHGDILIAAPANPYPPANRDWGPCLIRTANGPIALRHIFQTVENRWVAVALDREGPTQFAASVTWLARIITVVRHLREIRDGGAVEYVD